MDIVQEIRENREKGAKRLDSEYRGRLMAVAVRVCGDVEEAKSYVNQTFAEAIERIETLTNPDSFFSWMCSMLVNMHAKATRRKEHERVIYTDQLPDQAADGNADVAEAVDAELLREAIDDLPNDLKESLLLHYFMDLPLKQMAKILSVPSGTVMSRLYYARRVLAKRLGANLKRPAVALIAAALLLAACAATVVGVASAISGGGAAVGGLDGTSAAPCMTTAEDATNSISTTKEKQTMKKATVGGIGRRTLSGIKMLALTMLAVNAANADDQYIESDGTTGISTGYRLKPNSRIEVDFALTTTEQTGGARLFGADYNTTTLKIALGFYSGANAGNPYWVFGFGSASSGWTAGWPKDSAGSYVSQDLGRHTIVYDFPGGRHTYYTGGTAVAWQTDSKNYTDEATQPIAIFAAKNASGFEKPCKARIYGVKIYEKNGDSYELVHDFVPCLATGCNGFICDEQVPGFKDLETGAFIGNNDDRAHFTASDNVFVENNNPAYIATPETTAKQYIDTLYHATDQTRCEIDYALQSTPTASAWLFSGYGSATYGVYIKSGGSTFGMDNGGGWSGDPSIPLAGTLNVRRTVVLDFPNNKLHLVSGIETNISVSAKAVSGKRFAANTVKIAGRFNGGSEFAPIRIYGFRIYEAGTPKRNFVPCVSDGVPGLKDTITGLFVTYPGTLTLGTKLAYGGDIAVEANPYIETSATSKQYLNTGYQPINTTRFELDYALTAKRPSNTWVLFRGQNSVYFGAYNNDNGFGFINGNGWKSGVTTTTLADATGIRRTAILDNVANIAALITFSVTNGSMSCDNKLPAAKGGKAVTLSESEGFSASEYSSLRIYACRIYEGGNPVHEFLPTVKDGVPGLQDQLSDKFLQVLSNASSNPYVFGGAFTPAIAQSAKSLREGETVTLTASAPGAVSYRWFKNGEAMAGGENGTLVIAWRRGGLTDVYKAVSVCKADGLEAASAVSEGATVENIPSGLAIIIR